MLGGSASSQTSGAPFRTESDHRTSAWPPPPAHQNDLFNRGFGIFSLFPGPGDDAKTLYTAATAATPTKSGSPFPAFLEPKKAPDSFFPAKFPFTANESTQFDSSSNHTVQPGLSPRLDLAGRSPFGPTNSLDSYMGTVKVQCETHASPLPRRKQSWDDVIIIKNEVDEGQKGVQAECGLITSENEHVREVDTGREEGQGGKNDATAAEIGQKNEPDSTECRPLTENHEAEEISSTGSGINPNASSTCLEAREVAHKRGKCDVNVVDLSVHGSSTSASSNSSSSSSINRDVKTKTPDSSCSKGLTVNCKQYGNENGVSSKPSPTGRTLSLSANSGGCSRTTPVTFKHQAPEPEGPKSEVGSVVDAPTPIVANKMDPVEFSKYPNGSPFLGFAPLNNLYNSSALRVVDGQMINSVPYRDPFETYNRQRENLLTSAGVDDSFLRSNLSFLSPPANSYLPPKIDVGELAGYKGCQGEAKIGQNYMASSGERERKTQEGSFVNSTSSQGDRNNCSSSPEKVTPCQVAEVTSASSMLSPKIPNPIVIKEEAVASSSGGPPATDHKPGFVAPGQSTAVSSTVGVSLTKPRYPVGLEELKVPALNSGSPPSSILRRTVSSPNSINVSPAIGAAVYSGGIVCDDRSTSIWPTPAHNPGLWQYSAAIDYPAFPPVGFQLVREPITGHFLLIPASNIEALQRAILWPTYAPASSSMILPPISLQPNPPHLLLDTTNVSAVDFLTPDALRRTTTPQHRIIIPADNTAGKRKVIGPALIKFETSENAGAIVVSTCERDGSTCRKPKSSLLPARRGSPVDFAQLPVMGSDRSRVEPSEAAPRPVLSNSTDMPLPAETRPQVKPCVEKERSQCKPFASQGTEMKTEQESKGGGTTTATEPAELRKESTEIEMMKEKDDKMAVQREIEKRKQTKPIQVSIPDGNIKQELRSPPSQVDLSGLELLSNSIEQRLMFEKADEKAIKVENKDEANEVDKKELSNDACEGAVLLQNLKNGFWDREAPEEYEESDSKGLGGLGLLCALAEQRFQEEIGRKSFKIEIITQVNDAEEGKGGEGGEEEENSAICQKIDDEAFTRHQDSKDCDLSRNYPSEKEYLGNGVKIGDDEERSLLEEADIESPLMEESGDSCKKSLGRLKKGKRETSIARICLERLNRKSRDISPPVLERQTDYPVCKQEEDSDEDLAHDTHNSRGRLESSKPPTLTPEKLQPLRRQARSPSETKGKFREVESSKKRKLSTSMDVYSSKKRKVGRPKKHTLLNGNENSPTETIVAKKAKVKSNHYQYHPTENEDVTVGKGNCDASSVQDNIEERSEKANKIKPKLKAEPKVRESSPLPDEIVLEDWRKITRDEEEKDEEDVETEIEEEDSTDEGEVEDEEGDKEAELEQPRVNRGSKLESCVLTGEHIKSERCPVRTLTAMGGLFYAGQLSAIRAPDVYGITIDGERGHRPHIYSREEILRDSILEVKPEKAGDLAPGRRCCAYWSEQYRCLYPGTVSVPTSPDADPDDRFVNVEFDDGDSGKINIDDIRLLPDDYPIVEYDPNPLQSLSKRRRRTSGTSVESHSKERKSLDGQTNGSEKIVDDCQDETNSSKEPGNDHKDKSPSCESSTAFMSSSSERKHLKKKRREKLKRLQSLSVDGKKKHKKHRCSDEHRHHKHHKKHRKHKHKHGTKGGTGETETEVDKIRVKRKDKNKCKASDKNSTGKPKKCKDRTDSVESRSKMAAFLPARQLWGWSGKGFKRPGAKGRARKEFYKTIQRGKERITVGDCAVFLSTGRPDRPYIGRIESMWESWGTNMIVRVKWFYHPEETVGCPATLEYPGALFESPHVDENDVQTISHKCEVLPLKEYTAKLGNSPRRYEAVYDNNDVYYLAGYYDPTNITLKMEPGVK